MNSTKVTVDMLADLAMQAEIADPIDWGMLSIEERQAYNLMAATVIDQIAGLPEDRKLLIAMASMTKLLVENFVLNIKLQGNKK